MIELEGELAFLDEGGGDVVGLVVGGVVGLGGGEGFAVADGPDEFAAAEMERASRCSGAQITTRSSGLQARCSRSGDGSSK